MEIPFDRIDAPPEHADAAFEGIRRLAYGVYTTSLRTLHTAVKHARKHPHNTKAQQQVTDARNWFNHPHFAITIVHSEIDNDLILETLDHIQAGNAPRQLAALSTNGFHGIGSPLPVL